MSNIIDYARANTESFDKVPFNNADGLIMTQLANVKFDDKYGIDYANGGSKTIAEIFNTYRQNNPNTSSKEYQLLKNLSTNPRYQNLKLSNFVENPAQNKTPGFSEVTNAEDLSLEQFAAVTITYEQNGEKVNHMAFRATDASADGWTEDLLMLSSTQTQAQLDSVNYMNLVSGKVDGHLSGGGHSKGGNDFEFGYLFCNEDVRDRFISGYIYDSPGVHDDVIAKTSRFNSFQQLTAGHFLCPQDSIIGLLLHENINASFIFSNSSGFMEHDPYSWELDPITGEFIPSEQTSLSKYVNQLLDVSVDKMSLQEREALYGFIYYILQTYGDTNEFGDELNTDLTKVSNLFAKGWKDENGKFNFGKFSEIWSVFSEKWETMTKEERKDFIGSISCILSATVVTTSDFITDSIENWINDKMNRMGVAIYNASMKLRSWVNSKIETLDEIMKSTYRSFVSTIEGIKNWYNKSFNKGYQYATAVTYLELNTATLRSYANRLVSINGRICKLDERMDSLYKKVGLRDLLKLLKADLMTGYNWHISNCAKYLNETANDFDSIERDISSQY